jgi:hypothetical protein
MERPRLEKLLERRERLAALGRQPFDERAVCLEEVSLLATQLLDERDRLRRPGLHGPVGGVAEDLPRELRILTDKLAQLVLAQRGRGERALGREGLPAETRAEVALHDLAHPSPLLGRGDMQAGASSSAPRPPLRKGYPRARFAEAFVRLRDLDLELLGDLAARKHPGRREARASLGRADLGVRLVLCAAPLADARALIRAGGQVCALPRGL